MPAPLSRSVHPCSRRRKAQPSDLVQPYSTLACAHQTSALVSWGGCGEPGAGDTPGALASSCFPGHAACQCWQSLRAWCKYTGFSRNLVLINTNSNCPVV